MSVNKKAVAQSFSRAAPQYDQVAHVQKQVGQALLDLLQQQNVLARNALDIGCGTGWLTLHLQPFAKHITALDLAPGMLAYAKQRDRQNIINEFICADVESLPFSAQQYDLIFSSFALQWCDDIKAVFADIYNLLQPGGRFVFSIPVENTLNELKQSWAQAEAQHAHVNEFCKVADIQTALNQVGFSLPFFDERITPAYYQSVRELMTELKTLGAHHVAENGTTSLTGKNTIAKMLEAYEQFRNADGLLPASWHFILVCAQKPDTN